MIHGMHISQSMSAPPHRTNAMNNLPARSLNQMMPRGAQPQNTAYTYTARNLPSAVILARLLKENMKLNHYCFFLVL